MEMRALGASGLAVSALGLGTVKFGRNQALGTGSGLPLPSDAGIDRLLATALDLGITLLDTAPAYGTAEERLGRALAGRRERFVLCSKAGEEFDGVKSRFDFSPQAIRLSLERSLRRLRTDRLDILLLHSDGIAENEAKFGAAIAELGRLKAAGLVRAVGLSSKSIAGGLLAVETLDIVMVAFSRGDPSQRPVIEAARSRQVGVLIKKALGSGREPDIAAALRFAASAPGAASVVLGTIDAQHLAFAAEIIGKLSKETRVLD